MCKTKVVPVGTGGMRITVPKAIWSKLKLNVGDIVEFVVQKNGKVVLKKWEE